MRPACCGMVRLLCVLLGMWAGPSMAAQPRVAAQAGSGSLTGALANTAAEPPIEIDSVPGVEPGQRNGRQIYEEFRAGLADPSCDATATSARWKKHFGHAPGQLAKSGDDLLPLFGYVVDALRQADLPTEFALIPFVESGYKPGARSASGPAGLWQFIGITARNHGVAMRSGYDGRLSPVDSTQAAVRYLKTLHGMFGGDWRLAVMAYNAGEYRILQAMRRGGMNAQNAKPAALPGLSGVTYAYVEKLHALACIFQQADDREEWMRLLDRPVPRLTAQTLPDNAKSLDAYARSQDYDAALLRRLNPALAAGLARGGKPLRVLAPVSGQPGTPAAQIGEEPAAITASSQNQGAANQVSMASLTTSKLSHTVRRGESAWTIARRYGMQPQQLLSRNGLSSKSVLKPGMVLKLEADTGEK